MGWRAAGNFSSLDAALRMSSTKSVSILLQLLYASNKKLKENPIKPKSFTERHNLGPTGLSSSSNSTCLITLHGWCYPHLADSKKTE